MSFQIIGTARCRETRKCKLWFQERGVAFHFVDIGKRGLSSGELKSIAQKTSWDEMLDRDGKAWTKMQLEWKEFNPEEELNGEPLLLKTPVVRSAGKVVIGYKPDEWDQFLA